MVPVADGDRRHVQHRQAGITGLQLQVPLVHDGRGFADRYVDGIEASDDQIESRGSFDHGMPPLRRTQRRETPFTTGSFVLDVGDGRRKENSPGDSASDLDKALSLAERAALPLALVKVSGAPLRRSPVRYVRERGGSEHEGARPHPVRCARHHALIRHAGPEWP